MTTIIAFIFIFSVIVIVHEFGHYYFAKKAGIAMLTLGIVTVFALVLPPEYWVMLLSIVLAVLGIMLIKKT